MTRVSCSFRIARIPPRRSDLIRITADPNATGKQQGLHFILQHESFPLMYSDRRSIHLFLFWRKRMSFRKSSLIIAFPLVLLSAAAAAQDDPAAIMEALDADSSGTLSQTEASANEMIMSNWDAIDADANGEISSEELAILAQ